MEEEKEKTEEEDMSSREKEESVKEDFLKKTKNTNK